MASKSGFMKDALVLFAITLVSGLCLGFVYDITRVRLSRQLLIKTTEPIRKCFQQQVLLQKWKVL